MYKAYIQCNITMYITYIQDKIMMCSKNDTWRPYKTQKKILFTSNLLVNYFNVLWEYVHLKNL